MQFSRTRLSDVLHANLVKPDNKALKRVGIEQFKWHNLRHTWASWHVQNGTPLHILKELGGWAGYEMVLRYITIYALSIWPSFQETQKLQNRLQAKTGLL